MVRHILLFLGVGSDGVGVCQKGSARKLLGAGKRSGRGHWGPIYRGSTPGGRSTGFHSCAHSMKSVSKRGLKFLFQGFNPKSNHLPLYSRIKQAGAVG
jgi:hypothetical protein